MMPGDPGLNPLEPCILPVQVRVHLPSELGLLPDHICDRVIHSVLHSRPEPAAGQPGHPY